MLRRYQGPRGGGGGVLSSEGNCSLDGVRAAVGDDVGLLCFLIPLSIDLATCCSYFSKRSKGFPGTRRKVSAALDHAWSLPQLDETRKKHCDTKPLQVDISSSNLIFK